MDALKVFSTLALKGVFDGLAAELERALGRRLAIEIHATQALLEALGRGEQADVLFMTAEGVAAIDAQGRLIPGTRADLARSGIGVAVRAGAARPQIGSVEAFKRALLEAGSVARSRVGASGLYMVELLERLEIEDRVRMVVVDKGPVGAIVAQGGAELGVQQLCELAPVPGIEIVGPLPAELQRYTVFSAGVPKASGDPVAAQALVDLMRSPHALSAMRKNLLEPL